MKIKVCLWDLVGAGLILEAKSGSVYFNQTGGTACFNSELEGHFVPFNFDTDPEDYSSSLEYKLSQLFIDSDDVSSDVASSINALLKSSTTTSGVEVDMDMLDKSHESWVYVKIEATESNPLSYEGQIHGVLTWPNSD